MEDDTHDKLTKAYLEYFKHNEKWETRLSTRTYYATQQELRKIKKLAKQKETENRQLFQQLKSKRKADRN